MSYYICYDGTMSWVRRYHRKNTKTEDVDEHYSTFRLAQMALLKYCEEISDDYLALAREVQRLQASEVETD